MPVARLAAGPTLAHEGSGSEWIEGRAPSVILSLRGVQKPGARTGHLGAAGLVREDIPNRQAPPSPPPPNPSPAPARDHPPATPAYTEWTD